MIAKPSRFFLFSLNAFTGALLLLAQLAFSQSNEDKFIFEDTYPAQPKLSFGLSPPSWEGFVSAWTVEEISELKNVLAEIEKTGDGLILRSTVYRPIKVYRTSANFGGDIMYMVEPHGLVFGNGFFERQNKKSALIHELAHAADGALRFVDNQWSDLAGSRIDELNANLKIKGLSLGEVIYGDGVQVDPGLVENSGLPSLYGALNLGEALAVYTTRFATEEGYSPPDKIKEYLIKNMVSTDFAPDLPAAAFHRAMEAWQEGQLSQAVADFDRAVSLDPGYGEAFYKRGLLYLQMGLVQTTLKDLELALAIGPGEKGSRYSTRGKIYLQTGDYQRAIEDFSELINQYWDAWEAYFLRSEAFKKNGEIEPSIADLEFLIAQDPATQTSLVSRSKVVLSDIFIEIGGEFWRGAEFEKAKEVYTKARYLNPEKASLMDFYLKELDGWILKTRQNNEGN